MENKANSIYKKIEDEYLLSTRELTPSDFEKLDELKTLYSHYSKSSDEDKLEIINSFISFNKLKIFIEQFKKLREQDKCEKARCPEIDSRINNWMELYLEILEEKEKRDSEELLELQLLCLKHLLNLLNESIISESTNIKNKEERYKKKKKIIRLLQESIKDQ